MRPNYFHTKQKSYDDLFSVLFIDFDHSLHKNIKKLKNKKEFKDEEDKQIEGNNSHTHTSASKSKGKTISTIGKKKAVVKKNK